MLLSSLIPTLLTLLSFGTAVAEAHSLRSPRQHQGRSAALAERGISVGAPHYSLYLYDGLNSGNWPTAESLAPYNRVLLAFWTSSGVQGAASVWAGLSDSQRQSILDSYHSAGIAVMVSTFGAEDNVVSNNQDPTALAQSIASFVNQYGLDGVDVDFEDFDALQNNAAGALSWMTTFHQQLRSALPSSLISVAPTAWAYGSTFGSANSAFCKLQAAAGNTIDWYNIQFYNGFEGTWNTCENVFWNSDNSAFLSLKQITDMCGIPLSKAAIGKLWSTSQLAHDTPDQVPSPEILGGCIAQAGSQFGYPGTGIMIWVAEMGNWSGAINYLANTLSSVSNGGSDSVSSAAAASASSAATSDTTSPTTSGTTSGTASASGASAVASATADASVSMSLTTAVVSGSTVTFSTTVAAAASDAAAKSGSAASGPKSSGTASTSGSTNSNSATCQWTAPRTVLAAIVLAAVALA